eukprot:3010510-Amphidinium_carterae.1
MCQAGGPVVEERGEIFAESRESWRQAFLDGRAPQLSAAERLLRHLWLVPLPILGQHMQMEDWEPAFQFTEVALVALCWEGGIDSPLTSMVIAVPEGAFPEEFVDSRVDALTSAGLFVANGDAMGASSVMYVEVPGSLLQDGFFETTVADATVATFGDGVPYAPELFSLWKQPMYMNDMTLLYAAWQDGQETVRAQSYGVILEEM